MTEQHRTELVELLGETQHREFLIRAVDSERREIEGIAVPWGEVANLGWFTESMERGAVQDSDDALTYWRHADPIGKVIFNRDDPEGWFVRMKISKTPQGDEALTLARDGVVTKLSIGFEPVEYTIREDGPVEHVTHTKIRVREVSLVPLPAYDGAQVTNVREGAIKKGNTMTDPITPAPAPTPLETREGEPAPVSVVPQGDLEQQLAQLRGTHEELERRFAMFGQQNTTPVVDTRSAGEILKAMVAGDDKLIREYNDLLERAYTGATTADTIVKDGWVGDLTRLVFDSAPLLQFFSSGTLPETGLNIEYAQIKTNTVQVTKQAAEGDNLAYGKVAVETKTAPVDTFGGYTELSRREIERSSVNILNTNLEAMASATGQRMNLQLRAQYIALKAAQVTAGNTVGVPNTGADYADWLDALVDAAVKFTNAPLGLPIDGLIVNSVIFKALGRLTAEDGRPVLLTQPASGQGVNTVGTFNPSGLEGNLAGVTVVLDAGLPILDTVPDPDVAIKSAAFVNRRAIRSYISPVTRLQDENIINLSKQFSVYNYAAFANEIPGAVVPVVFA